MDRLQNIYVVVKTEALGSNSGSHHFQTLWDCFKLCASVSSSVKRGYITPLNLTTTLGPTVSQQQRKDVLKDDTALPSQQVIKITPSVLHYLYKITKHTFNVVCFAIIHYIQHTCFMELSVFVFYVLIKKRFLK